jgi:hypothetical protein
VLWFFERGSEFLTLDVCRNAAAFEVHVQEPDGKRTVAFSGAANQLVEQIHSVPQALMAAGWRPRLQLDFPSAIDQVTPHDPQSNRPARSDRSTGTESAG